MSRPENRRNLEIRMGRSPESSLLDQREHLGELRQRGFDPAEGGLRQESELGRSFGLVVGHGRFQWKLRTREVSASENDSEKSLGTFENSRYIYVISHKVLSVKECFGIGKG